MIADTVSDDEVLWFAGHLHLLPASAQVVARKLLVEHDHLRQAHDVYRDAGWQAADNARAQLAALAQASRAMLASLMVPDPMPRTIEGKLALLQQGMERQVDVAVALNAALNAPDVAALVRERELERAVIAAAREVDRDLFHAGVLERLRDALVALDAGRAEE
jgi:hypothetical protein